MIEELRQLGFFETSRHLFMSPMGLLHEARSLADLQGLLSLARQSSFDDDMALARMVLSDVNAILA